MRNNKYSGDYYLFVVIMFAVFVMIFFTVIFIAANEVKKNLQEDIPKQEIEEKQVFVIEKIHYEEPKLMESEEIEPEIDISEEEADLMARIVWLEARGECEEGQRLVVDVILNRMEDKHFPKTIIEVIYQKNQFSSLKLLDTSKLTNDILDLVYQECNKRTNYDVVYFRTKHYHPYGTPLFVVGNHYFSGN